jgi:hypothetical protein
MNSPLHVEVDYMKGRLVEYTLLFVGLWLTSVCIGQAATQVGGYPMPSLEDERNTYRKWGWTWTLDKEPGAVTEPIPGYSVPEADIHGDTEGDDLWTYLMMYRRTGNPVYLNRANAWADYFKSRYRTSVDFDYDRGFGLDHLWGWGLLALYEHSNYTDTTALAEAERIAAEVEFIYSPSTTFGCAPTNGCVQYGIRMIGRHIHFLTRLGEITGNSRWISLRDRIINLLLSSDRWDPRGMYCNLDSAPGDCKMGTFQVGVLAEALQHAYRVTRNPEIKNRLIAMARFVDQYGLDPYYQYSGSEFGVVNGKPWHNYSVDCGTTCTYWDPVYTTSLVDTLVLGYKFTGDTHLLDRARYFFNRGTKGVYGSPTKRSSPDNVVDHFVDTKFATGTGNFYLDYNKGELQYTYLIFENGGSPTVEPGTPAPDTMPPAAPTNLRVQ